MFPSSMSNHDRKDLEKIVRVLALKVAQVIVQSRNGEKLCTQCKPNSSSADWFNLAIVDSAEILAETKRFIQDDLIDSPVPMCIEISVRTAEGQRTVLETWILNVAKEESDHDERMTNTRIYNRMGLLLKSLLSVTRMTPAYKISRRQHPDCYVVCYRMFMGEPQMNNLGSSSKHVRVGSLNSELGAIHLSVSYRTTVTFSPTRRSPDKMLMKSDHFEAEASPKNAKKGGISETFKLGAFAEDRRISVNEDTDDDIPFSSLLSMGKSSTPSIAERHVTPTPEDAADTCDGKRAPPRKSLSCPPRKSWNCPRLKSSSCPLTSVDKLIMAGLKSPFAVTHDMKDLGSFYRECQSAPLLLTRERDMTIEEQIGNLTKRLERFEVDMQVFDDFVDSLCKRKTAK